MKPSSEATGAADASSSQSNWTSAKAKPSLVQRKEKGDSNPGGLIRTPDTLLQLVSVTRIKIDMQESMIPALAFLFATASYGQFVVPAAELAGLPSGDTQKVILSGWTHCNSPNAACKSGGNANAYRFGGGGNTYDKQGNIFSPVYVEINSVLYFSGFSILHINGTITQFGSLTPVKCTQLSSTEIQLDTQAISYLTYGGPSFSFNLESNTFQYSTTWNRGTYTADLNQDPTSSVRCTSSSGYTITGATTEGATDSTVAYMTVTGSSL
jgi:hypothetical protein